MLQIAPQSMPAGLEVTDPLPVPALLIVRVAGGIKLKVAVQLRSAVIVTLPSEQSASPAQPLKREPAAGVAVSVTTCAKPNGAPQTTPQLMPAGIEVTVPLPVPVRVSVRVEGGIKLKVAVQPWSEDIVTLPSEQSASPVQPAKAEPAAGVAVSVTA